MAFYPRRLITVMCVFTASLSMFVLFRELQHLDKYPDGPNISGDNDGTNTIGNALLNVQDTHDEHDVDDGNAFSSETSVKKFIRIGMERKKDLMRRKPLTSLTQDGKNSMPWPTLQTKPVFVVILAQMRTGSSVVGQLFNANKNFFYIYEPLHFIQDWEKNMRNRENLNETITEIFHNMSQCRFSQDFIKSIGEWGGRTKSRALMPLCKRRNSCSDLPPIVLEHICSLFNGNIATKVIRASLHHLKPLVEVNGIDVKIIHLVRDPRGTTNSRLEYYLTKGFHLDTIQRHNGEEHLSHLPGVKVMHVDQNDKHRLANLGLVSDRYAFPESVVRTIKRLCQWMTSTTLAASQRPAWLRGRYMLVRYEDFAEKPIRTARDMYKFLGRITPPDVLEWIQNNTRDNLTKDPLDNGLYSMHKNASATASRWRFGLNWDEVVQIQRECGEVMGLLGYKELNSPTDLTDLSVSLLEPLHLPNI